MNLRQRSYQPELLDRSDIPFGDIRQNMAELDRINTLLGGHAITVKGIRRLLKGIDPSRPLHICEIGCGGGDNLRAVVKAIGGKAKGGRAGGGKAKGGRLSESRTKRDGAKSRACGTGGNEAGGAACKPKLRLTGIDLKPECIRYARDRWTGDAEVEWVVSDYRDVTFREKPDIIFSSLFCHHFTDGQVAEIFRWCAENSRLGFFMNDLQRHPLAYHSIAGLTKLFSRSYLVKNDAPLSVARGFSRGELTQMLAGGLAGMTMQTGISWQWAFRWLVTATHTLNKSR